MSLFEREYEISQNKNHKLLKGNELKTVTFRGNKLNAFCLLQYAISFKMDCICTKIFNYVEVALNRKFDETIFLDH